MAKREEAHVGAPGGHQKTLPAIPAANRVTEEEPSSSGLKQVGGCGGHPPRPHPLGWSMSTGQRDYRTAHS